MRLNIKIIFSLLVLSINFLQIILMIISEVFMLLNELLYFRHYLKVWRLINIDEIFELFLSYLKLLMLLKLYLLKHALLNVFYLFYD
jgi:hypothetical protein